jgi:uncharacterized membrane protein (DUF441 family)
MKMNWDNLPILIILVLSVIGDNHTVSIAALILLLIRLLGFDTCFPYLEKYGVNAGIIILTLAILTPVAQGTLSMKEMMNGFKSSSGIIAILIGIFVSWVASQGLDFMKASPEVVTALIVGTIAGVCFFHGLAIGPLIAGGIVSLIVSLLGIFNH